MDVSEVDIDPIPPPTEAVFHILLVLADEDWHGYGIMQEIERLTGGRVRLGPGTLYRSLQRMRVDGMIEEVDESGENPAVSERRRTYRVTAFGLAVVRAEARRLAGLVDLAEARGLLSGASAGENRR